MKYFVFTESRENDGYEPNLTEFNTLEEIEDWFNELIEEG
jgi:hypothetical protein